MIRVARFLMLLLLTAGTGAAAEYRVPLMERAPSVDGNIEPAEWASSAAFDGFAMDGTLEQRRIRAYVGATTSHLYFALKSQLPAEGEILSAVNVDTVKIVYDDSVEVWIDPTPGSEHGKTFQMLANAVGRQGYNLHVRGNVPAEPGWRGNWRVANGFRDGYWHCEVEGPIEGIAPGRTADQGAWGINLCRNWKQPWAFSSLGGAAYPPEGVRFVFAREDVLSIAHEVRRDPFVGDLDMALTLRNPTAKPISVRAGMSVKRDMMPELATSESLTLPPGEERQVALTAQDPATRKFDLEVSVASPDGRTTYYSRSYSWQRGEPFIWVTQRKEAPPIDVQFGYYPYLGKMRALADVSNLPEDAVLDRLTCEVRKRGRARAIKSVVFDRFVDGRQDLTLDLPPLQGEYEIAVRAHGKNVPQGELIKEFERTVYEWEHAGLGTSKRVYPPFTPIRVQGMRVSTVLREHTMNDLGLWDQVVAAGQPLLAAPMRLRAVADGALIEPRAKRLRFTRTDGNEAVAEASFEGTGLRGTARCTWDYDGMMRVDLELQPNPQHTLNALTLEVPLKDSQARLYHAMGDGIRNTLYEAVPAGDGVVWTSDKVAVNDFPPSFCSYIFVGTPARGLSWFAENDRGWSWDPKTPNVDLVRRGDTLTMRVHLVNRPVTIAESRTITFGLLAAPVKPRLGNWRYAYNRENYTLLGTDINWFALGNCGSVYPAGKDLYLWEMLARGNRERLLPEQIQQVIDHGKRYFEPYGEDYVEQFARHVRYNLQSRYGMKMILYYNRASYQAADEFQTFQDEWSLTDYRTVGKGNGVGEIKIVPSDSYIDHALYWYGKAFDVANSRGVYWDNWFFVGSYNRMMTGAHRRDDGSIMPSNGLWGLRELSKRTFQYMNERGMPPITMAHMTSTNILPLLSFCTVQYDWEWKYSEGDVQYRFPRDYILLVSNGELAGTWPVLLQDHGKLAEDPWTQRTFAAVCIVHELTGWGLPKVWEPPTRPIYDLLDRPGLEVYRYWDERPQPVTSGDPDLPTIVYSVKGEQAVFAIVSYAEGDVEADVRIDPTVLGFGRDYRVLDVETGDELLVRDDRVAVMVKKHDIREFRIVPGGGG